MLLRTPDEILSIPQRLGEFNPDRSMIRRFWQPTDEQRLDHLLFGTSGILTPTKCAS